MYGSQTITASGASAALKAPRDCALVFYSDDWDSETAALELSDNGTEFQAAKDDTGAAIVLDSNDTYAVRGGFYYRIDKSAGTAEVRMSLVETPAASEL